jgi:hypothetical protein
MILTPKEKAKQLVEKMIIYHSPDDKDYEAAIDCALIAVDEILNAIQDLPIDDVNWNYWQEVKQEIEAL